MIEENKESEEKEQSAKLGKEKSVEEDKKEKETTSEENEAADNDESEENEEQGQKEASKKSNCLFNFGNIFKLFSFDFPSKNYDLLCEILKKIRVGVFIFQKKQILSKKL